MIVQIELSMEEMIMVPEQYPSFYPDSSSIPETLSFLQWLVGIEMNNLAMEKRKNEKET